MKIRKTAFFGLIVLSTVGLVATSTSAIAGSPSAPVRDAIGQYFASIDSGLLSHSARSSALSSSYASGAAYQSSSRSLSNYESSKAANFQNWFRMHGDVYHSITTSFTMQVASESESQQVIDVNAVTTMLWSGSAGSGKAIVTAEKAASMKTAAKSGRAYGPGDIVTSKVSADHHMTLVSENGAWKIASDSYLDPFVQGVAADHVSKLVTTHPEQRQAAPTTVKSGPTPYAYTASYNRNLAAAYADKYWNNYNTFYHNYNDSGGDCANFVSQALWDPSAANFPSESPYWYVNTDGTASTDFIYTPSQHNFFIANPHGSSYSFATLGSKATWSAANTYNINSMLQGDVIFYDWNANGGIDHTAIAVAYASDATTLMDAHNTNHYQVRWDLGAGSGNIYYQDKFKESFTAP